LRAGPGYQVTSAHALRKPVSDLPQQLIPPAMSQRIVDGLEIVEVEKQQRKRSLASSRLTQTLGDVFGHHAAIGKTG
jgi:hypothetical protein